ncbi:MAG TPA: diacylglycerol kinase family protein [Vitreimonas sp.]|uniref:diacylglycerol/lipid kinase family protein n=1 Tax=Vitreimonas sp. TaxID=3069702 RepID=UPI002D51DE0F|nr:diacylglycerol kinase family protein [Vitreimonas sp.]HYD87489.1 diacylglycerol kinase family protein [Vitreimonas sp.]
MDPAATAERAPRQSARPVPENARAMVLYNDKAGGVGPGDHHRLVLTLADAGVVYHEIFEAKYVSKRLLAKARSFDVLVVLGGDGTARTAAELAPRDGPPLILLPGGTLNILPRALYGEMTWPEALQAALERGRITRLTAGRANGEAFYVAALFGAPTLMAKAREAMREGRPLAAWRRFRQALKRSFSRSLRARRDQETMRRAEAIGVLCPSFSGGIQADNLEWVRLDARHLLDLARVSLRALTAAWRNDPSVEIGTCRSSDIVSLGVIPATLDGEPRTFFHRVRVVYDPRGPRVIAVPQGV